VGVGTGTTGVPIRPIGTGVAAGMVVGSGVGVVGTGVAVDGSDVGMDGGGVEVDPSRVSVAGRVVVGFERKALPSVP
jgi:hypothetical protein